MRIIYNLLVVPLLYLVFHVLYLYNEKVRSGVRGRKNLFQHLEYDLREITKQKVWFHVSSYGEFEQAKPVLKKLKDLKPEIFIIVTFYSPSAYDNIKLAQPVDYICYLPFDSQSNARRFFSIVTPDLAVIVRHDIWPNFIWTSRQNNIPLILIDASIPEKSSRLWWIFRPFNRNLYNSFDLLLTISDVQTERINGLLGNDTKTVLTGDTKFDQVYQRALETTSVDNLKQHPYLKEKKIWIIGSSWPADETRVIPAFARLVNEFNWLIMIIAPHEPSENRTREIESQLKAHQISSIRYTKLTNNSANFQALIVDKMGFLANIYSLGMAAFVGGSYEQNVHNVLEPAAHGIPVLYGPKIETQPEAGMLIKADAGFVMTTVDEIVDKMTEFITDQATARIAGEKAKNIVLQHAGASEKTTDVLLRYLKKER